GRVADETRQRRPGLAAATGALLGPDLEANFTIGTEGETGQRDVNSGCGHLGTGSHGAGPASQGRCQTEYRILQGFAGPGAARTGTPQVRMSHASCHGGRFALDSPQPGMMSSQGVVKYSGAPGVG